MALNRIIENIDGAPFTIGQKVKVVNSIDDTFDETTIDKIGKIDYYEYNCGCGQSYPEDPMIGVFFSDGQIKEFWKEELEVISNG